MTSMSPWKPWEFAQLTPLQLLCMSSERPPDRGKIATAEQYAAMAERPGWEDTA